ncbi:MAG: putative septation protein SpoVG [Planctomycetota bacterium]|jgi:stage V sporulation protein G
MMEITEVRIKLMEDSEDRLRAFCSITIDHCFVVRDLKIIEGASGPFVAMPSRKLTSRCHRCGHKNYLRTAFCSHCGVKLRASQEVREEEGPANKLYADIAHPINQACRDLIQKAVLQEYQLELERAKVPGYRSRYDEAYVEGVEASSGSVPVGFPDTSSPKRPHMLEPNSKPASGADVSEIAKNSSGESSISES